MTACGQIAEDDQVGRADASVDDGLPSADNGPAAIAGFSNSDHTCVWFSDGRLLSWGKNSKGQVGDGEHVPQICSPETISSMGPIRRVSRSGACAVTNAGVAYCWQSEDYGGPDSPLPTAIAIDDPIDISGDLTFGCVIHGASRSVACWGQSTFFPSGSSSVPVDVGISDAVMVDTVPGEGCAALGSGDLVCWGNAPGPAGSLNKIEGFHDVVVFRFGDVALTSDGHVIDDWGAGAPKLRDDLEGVVDVAAGFALCALLGDGSVWCWGSDEWGELGNGGKGGATSTARRVPVIHDAVSLSADNRHVCALESDGSIWCWGLLGEAFCVDGGWSEIFGPTKMFPL